MKKKGNEKIGKEREKSIAERFAEELVEEIKEDFKERQQARRPYELSWQLNMNFLREINTAPLRATALSRTKRPLNGRKNRCSIILRPYTKRGLPSCRGCVPK